MDPINLVVKDTFVIRGRGVVVHPAVDVDRAKPARLTVDLTYSDGGWDAGLLFRIGKESGYRVQLSHSLQQVALVKYPNGGKPLLITYRDGKAVEIKPGA